MDMSSNEDKMAGKALGFKASDLKSKATKYKRWTPKMDLFLVKLLFDIVHSYHKDARPQLNKRGWSYICNQLRIANPETVYSTYTKYSCQQHLVCVIHRRYKLWCELMIHSKHLDPNQGYSFKWNPILGRFEIIITAENEVITDKNLIKSVIYGDSLPLPNLEKHYKGNVIVNDFFLSDHFLYISQYHNEVLPMLIDFDPSFGEGLQNLYEEIPKFEYSGFNVEYNKPLSMKRAKGVEYSGRSKVLPKKVSTSTPSLDISLGYNNFQHLSTPPSNINHTIEPPQVDPHLYQHLVSQSATHHPHASHSTLSTQHHDPPHHTQPHHTQPHHTQPHHDLSLEQAKRARDLQTDFEGDLTATAIPELNSPQPYQTTHESQAYQKDRPWFTKLMSLHEKNFITINEFFTVLEGVRDSKFPLPLLNILDPGSTDSKYNDHDIAQRTKKYIVPLCESFKN